MAGRYTWMQLRAVAPGNDSGLAADKCNWDNVKDLDNLYEIPGFAAIGALQLAFKGIGSVGQVMNWLLYLVKGNGSPAEYVAHGTATLGVTQTGNSGEYYANAISISNQNWNDKVEVIDGYQYDLGSGEVANGGIAKLQFDGCEYQYALLFMSNNTTSQCGADITNYRVT